LEEDERKKMEEKIKRLHKRWRKNEEDVRGERGRGGGDERKI
jgi:hypothetical protein